LKPYLREILGLESVKKSGVKRLRAETVGAIAAISPYLTEHINRFGDYTLNLDRKPPQPDYSYTLKRAAATH
jgi:hypothetical protein